MSFSELKNIPLKVKGEVFYNSAGDEEKVLSPITEDGSVNWKGNPAVKAKTGRWNSAVILLGATMDTNIATFHIPPASMSVLDILSVLMFIGIYRRILIPVLRRLTKNPKGLTELQRMGGGLVIGMLAMVAAGIVELKRLKRVTVPHEPSSFTIVWQIPQYALIGASEVFMYVGQLEFFNAQAPDGIKSFGSSLCMASISLGNYVSIMLVNIVMGVTAGEEKPGWIPEDLNNGQLDRFFFLLAGLTVIDFIAYCLCARWYKHIKVDGSEDEVPTFKEPN